MLSAVALRGLAGRPRWQARGKRDRVSGRSRRYLVFDPPLAPILRRCALPRISPSSRRESSSWCRRRTRGPWYDLDTLLRPSGSQGLLVNSDRGICPSTTTSDLPERAIANSCHARRKPADWELQALVARAVRAGGPVLEVIRRRPSDAAAYERNTRSACPPM